MHFPYQPTHVELPPGFVPRQLWPEYMPEQDIIPFLRPHMLATTPHGRRWGRWPVYFEEYIGDIEPTPNDPEHNPGAPARIVRWLRLNRKDIPAGWKQWSKHSYQIEGFATLTPGGDHTKLWSESAKRGYKKRIELERAGYRIEPITYVQFAKGYKNSSVAKRTLNTSIEHATHKNDAGNGHLAFWGVVRENEIIAGLCVVESPTHQSSYYTCGFIHPKQAKSSAMTWLMHHWHEASLEKGITFLHFGLFWSPGQPKNWRGFSEFKSKFGLTYFAFPPALYRLKGKTRA